MTKKEWVTRAFNGEAVDRVPAGFWFHFLDNSVISAGMEDPSLIEQNLAGHRRFNEEYQPDFVKMMTDGLFYRPESTYPTLSTAHDLARVRPLGRRHAFLDTCVEHARRVREIFGDDILIFYNIPSPFHHILKQLTGTSGMKAFPPCILEDRDAFISANSALLEDMVDLTERVMTEGTMDGIYLGLHNDNVFSTEEYDSLIKPSELQLLETANAIHPINIAHVCGYRGRVNNFDVYRDYPATVFNWSLHTTNLSIAAGRRFFYHCRSVIGGFDQTPGSLIHAGGKEEIQRFVWDLLDENGTQVFILGADCTIPSDTPIEHLVWAKEACGTYAGKKK